MDDLIRMIAAACATLCVAAASPARAGGQVQPVFDLAQFSTPLEIDNPYWPLPEGLHIVYQEVSGDECVANDFIVTAQTKALGGDYAGLTARVVSDQEWLDLDCDGGRDVLVEDTLDWYAQDDAGNIWYFGEATTEYEFDDEGNPTGSNTLGSWEAGVDGAVAGLVMLAEPGPGASYQQEFYAGIAEDQAKVIGVGRAVSTGLGDFSGCVVIKEWTPLSPGAIEHKHYCPDVGLLLIEGFGQEHDSGAEAVDFDPELAP